MPDFPAPPTYGFAEAFEAERTARRAQSARLDAIAEYNNLSRRGFYLGRCGIKHGTYSAWFVKWPENGPGPASWRKIYSNANLPRLTLAWVRDGVGIDPIATARARDAAVRDGPAIVAEILKRYSPGDVCWEPDEEKARALLEAAKRDGIAAGVTGPAGNWTFTG